MSGYTGDPRELVGKTVEYRLAPGYSVLTSTVRAVYVEMESRSIAPVSEIVRVLPDIPPAPPARSIVRAGVLGLLYIAQVDGRFRYVDPSADAATRPGQFSTWEELCGRTPAAEIVWQP